MTVIQLSPTLEEVSLQFSLWRSQKRNPKEQIPERLWNLVRQLTEKYSATKIIKYLGLSSRQFRRQGLLATPNTGSKKQSFVNIKLPSSLAPLTQPSYQLLIQRPDGAKLSLANLTDEQFVLSIKTFLT